MNKLTMVLASCLVASLALPIASPAANRQAPLKKGHWIYHSRIRVKVKDHVLRTVTKTWNLCSKHVGDPPLIIPKGKAIIRCTHETRQPLPNGLRATLTCTSTADGSTSILKEDFTVFPSHHGKQSLVHGTIDTRVGGMSSHSPMLVMDVDSKGQWLGPCTYPAKAP